MNESNLTGEELIIFTRFPHPGQTKTRLIPALGAAGAADLQRVMAEYTFKLGCSVAAERNLTASVHYEGGDAQELRRWVPAALHCTPQEQGSLGRRLALSFTGSFARGKDRVIIIGSDCPFLTLAIVATGFDLLGRNDLVIGPAHDGGYYLIGLSKPVALPWDDIDWGTEKVLHQTVAAARLQGAALALLPPLVDIDRPEDLSSLYDADLGVDFFAGGK